MGAPYYEELNSSRVTISLSPFYYFIILLFFNFRASSTSIPFGEFHDGNMLTNPALSLLTASAEGQSAFPVNIVNTGSGIVCGSPTPKL
jgi:hypothetical protein